MKIEVKKITPKLATEYLLMVVPGKQRTLKDRLVDQYAKAMENGHWATTHQGIAFDESGSLCDGQHRLSAIVKSGVTIEMIITRGLPERQGELFTFDAIDRGSQRGIGEQIQVRHGIKDANRMAAGARVIAMICKRNNVKMTVENTLHVLNRFGESIQYVNHCFKINSMRNSSAIGSLAFCHRAMPKELDEFILRVGDGDGIKRGDPSFCLRNALLTASIQNGFGIIGGHTKSAALCAMHHVLGNKLTVIKQSVLGIDFFSNKQPRILEEVASLF